METRKLEIKDICGYLPYGLKGQVDGVPYSIIGIETDTRLVKTYLYDNKYNDDYWNLSVFKIILHPISDLYKTITHNGKEIVPIKEIKEKFYIPSGVWHLENNLPINNYQLFDYLHELKIDYRGLIDADLAIDVNTLNENPYK